MWRRLHGIEAAIIGDDDADHSRSASFDPTSSDVGWIRRDRFVVRHRSGRRQPDRTYCHALIITMAQPIAVRPAAMPA